MGVMYDGSAIIPAPLVRIEKEVERNAAGARKRPVYTLTVTGTLINYKGSPRSDGTFWTLSGSPPDETVSADARLAAMRAKQGALCSLFCREHKWLEFQPWDGSAATKCQPRLRSLTFADGIWFDVCNYTAVFEADTVWFGSQECCAADSDESDPVEESWELEQADDAARTYRLTHTAAASFRDLYDASGLISSYGWERAKSAVTARLGFQSSKAAQSGVLGLSGLAGYNLARVVTENRSDGSYRVAETWLCYDPAGGAPAIEDYTVTTRSQAGRSTVSVEGSVQGLMVRADDYAVTSTKYENAATKWGVVRNLILTRAQAASGLTLNPTPLSEQTARNEITGLITYGYEYDDRYTYGGAITLEVTLQDQNAADVFASIPVVGRPAGPVLQDIGSTTETSRTVTVDAQFRPASYASGLPGRPDLSALILAYQPVASQLYVSRSDEQWLVTANRYTKTVTWTYQ